MIGRSVRAAVLATAAFVCAASAQAQALEPLVPNTAYDGDSLPEPLSANGADPAKGQAIFVDRNRGHCVLCHAVDGLDAPFQGNVGPALTAVAVRLDDGQIRARIVDPTRANPAAVMPAYYRISNLNQVSEPYRGKPVLTADEIEHLVAYLSGLDGDE